MIRINLLAVERKPVPTGIDVAQKVTIGCTLLLLATAALLGWRYWSLRQESANLDLEITAARVEADRLHSVLEQVAEFEKRRGQLQQRVALIEELRKGQSAPVHLLDEVSRALPDRLWLTQMQQVDHDVKIEGRTTALTSLSDFVGNLESSGYFARPVEILDSQVENTSQAQAGAAATGDVVKFTVKGQFSMPGMSPPAAGASTPPQAAAAAAPVALTARR